VTLYLDASVVVPTLIAEATSPEVDRFFLAPAEPLMVGEFAAAETASAISRLVRMNLVTEVVATERLAKFDSWRSTSTSEFAFQPADFLLASMLVRRFELGLRAPDALHLAACRRGDHTLVTLDRRLAGAAEALGVRVTCLAA
jgi:hypothetical protein